MHLPNLVGIVGEFGSGKSLNLLRISIENAQKTRRRLVLFFPFSRQRLNAYLVSRGYYWLCSYNRVRYVNPHLGDDIIADSVFSTNTVFALDEAGIFFNSRLWKKTGSSFLKAVFQLRHRNTTLIYACHFLEQVDRQLRDVTQLWLELRGFTRSSASGSPRLFAVNLFWFRPARYNRWLEDIKAKSNQLRTWFMATKSQTRILNRFDYALFGVYDSFGSPGGGSGRLVRPDVVVVDDYSLQNVTGTRYLNYPIQTQTYLSELLNSRHLKRRTRLKT